MSVSGFSGEGHDSYPSLLPGLTGGLSFRAAPRAGWRLRTGARLAHRGGVREAPVTVTVFDSTYDTGLHTNPHWSETVLEIPILAEAERGAGSPRPYAALGPLVSWRVGSYDPGEGRLPSPDRSRNVDVAACLAAGIALVPQRVRLEARAAIAMQSLFPAGRGPRIRCHTGGIVVEVSP